MKFRVKVSTKSVVLVSRKTAFDNEAQVLEIRKVGSTHSMLLLPGLLYPDWKDLIYSSNKSFKIYSYSLGILDAI